jgi:general secretion pathway protein F
MAVYAYKASNPIEANQPVRGTLAADSPRAARDQLRARGLRVRELTELRGRWAANDSVRRPTISRLALLRGRPEARVTALCRELSTLLAAGIPLLQALDGIVRQHRGRFQACLMLLRDRIAAGASLGEAMRDQPEVFDPLSVSLVEVGERAGTLDDVLEQLALFRHHSQQFRGRLATALVYPMIVVVAGIAVTLFLMTFVVPQLLQALVEAGASLPLMTRVVKAISDGLLYGWWLLLPGFGGLSLTIALALRRPRVRGFWHAAQLRIPIVGDLIRKQAIIRIAVSLATLTRSGIEFVVALRIVRASIGNIVIRDALQRCEEAVVAGRDIAPALEATGVFPPTVVQIVDVGQATGRLDTMLDRLAGDYDLQVQAASQRLVALLEPVLILLLATFIGVIVLSVILPYMGVGNVL